MLRYAMYRLQLAHAVGECILQRGGSDVLFPNDLGGLVTQSDAITAAATVVTLATGWFTKRHLSHVKS